MSKRNWQTIKKYEDILFDFYKGIAKITINRPEVYNAFRPETNKEIIEALETCIERPDVRVVVLTGAGDKAFCAGADLKELIPEITSERMKIMPDVPAFLKNIEIYKPIISAINGFCFAGGTELIQGTDIRIAVEQAIFGLTEPRWGLFPAAGSTVRLLRQIPYCRAMEILLIGDPVTAQEALKIGLINKVVKKEDLLPTATRIAERICENSLIAMRAIKESALKCYEIPMKYANILECSYAREVFTSEDAKEGPKAFLEKRKPVFQGK